jgi:hypothetical protein
MVCCLVVDVRDEFVGDETFCEALRWRVDEEVFFVL